MQVITRESINDEFAVFLEVDAETLQEILANPEFYNDKELMIRAWPQKGEHAVMLILCVDHDVEIVRRKIDQLLKTHKTVSWYNRDHKRYYTQHAKKEEVNETATMPAD